MAAGGRPSGRVRALVWAGVFLLGLAGLLMEVLGARLLAPRFGSGTGVWSALIAVALASLGGGYWAGGLWADHRPKAGLFFAELCAAGLLTLLSALSGTAVLSVTAELGLLVGALAASTVLLGPALFAAGASVPLAVRLVTDDHRCVGHGSGAVYGVSTAGGVAGALLAGFILAPSFGVGRVLTAAGLGLAGLGAAGLSVSGFRMAGVSVLAASGLFAAGLFQERPAAPSVLLKTTSFYGELRVEDGPEDRRFLFLDGMSNGCVHRATGEPCDDYLYAFELLPHLRPGRARALVIGLGAGSVPTAYAKHHGLAVDVAEIDPAVVRAAGDLFGFVPSGRVALQDGRVYLMRGGDSYDFVAVDAFSADHIPAHLFSREFFALVKSRLAPGGVLALNSLGSPADTRWRPIYKTLSSVFTHVEAFATAAGGNLIFVASEDALAPQPDLSSARPPAREALDRLLARRLAPPAAAELETADVFTDDFNRMDATYQEMLMAWREEMLRLRQDAPSDGARRRT